MKLHTASFLGAAEASLSDARACLTIALWRQSARLACYTRFHAAQALIYERTDTRSKTHRGVSNQFHKICRLEALPSTIAEELSASYQFKEVADYDTDNLAPVTEQEARDTVAAAALFVATIRNAVG